MLEVSAPFAAAAVGAGIIAVVSGVAVGWVIFESLMLWWAR